MQQNQTINWNRTVWFCTRYWHRKHNIYGQNDIWKSYWKMERCLHVFYWIHQSLWQGTTCWTSQDANEFRYLWKGHTSDLEPVLGPISLYKSREWDEMSEYTKIKRGVHQGCVLSETNWTLLMIIRKRQLEFHGHNMRKNGLEELILKGSVDGKRSREDRKKYLKNLSIWVAE